MPADTTAPATTAATPAEAAPADASATTSTANVPDRSTELAGLAELLEAGDPSEPTPATPAAAATAEAEAKPDDRAATAEEKPTDKQEPLGKSYAEIRRKRQELAVREETVAKNERALAEKATKAEATLSLVAKAAGGDLEALHELGIDLEKIGAKVLAGQSGDARVDRLERTLAERDAADQAAKQKAQDEAKASTEKQQTQQTYVALRHELTQASKGLTLLSKRDPDQRVAMCEEVAQDFVAQKRSFSLADIAKEAEVRLTKAAEELAESLGYVKPAASAAPAAAAATPRTIGRADAAVKGAPKQGPKNRKEELQEIAALFD